MYTVMDNLAHDFSMNTIDSSLEDLIEQIADKTLQNHICQSYESILVNHQHRVSSLEKKLQVVCKENQELKMIVHESQRRYEKAVREMQFFKRKHDQYTDWDRSSGMFSTSTDTTSVHSRSSRNPSMVSSYSTPQSSSNSSIPYTPIRSTMIMQRKTDPLCFGGSDALWDTISKAQGPDMSVEKNISNFLRRGGSPNTAKQSSSSNHVKYGYGMIHALIVTKAPDSLDLLLQQGANPNAATLGSTQEDRVSPCYLAASIGWIQGLQRLVEAGGDLMSARGEGKKTALHTAIENGHMPMAECIIHLTGGALNYETDHQGASTLHYACASGQLELVTYLIQACQLPIDHPDHRGETPIHWAIRQNRSAMVGLLTERFGANINAYAFKKTPTPYDLAKSLNHKKLADYIKARGGLTSKKMDKKREDELAKEVPKHLENVLTKNGFFMG